MKEDLLNNYLFEINTKQYISEDITKYIKLIKKINLKKLITSLNESAKNKNFDKIKGILKSIKIPFISNNNIVDNMTRLFPNFKNSYKLSKKVISNSIPTLSDKVVDSVSIAVATKSIYKSKNVMSDTRENLMTTVKQLRKYIGFGVGDFTEAGNIVGATIVIIFLISGIAVIASYGFGSIIPLIFVGILLMVMKNLVSDY